MADLCEEQSNILVNILLKIIHFSYTVTLLFKSVGSYIKYFIQKGS